MATMYMTEDRRCGSCGEPVDKVVSEPVAEPGTRCFTRILREACDPPAGTMLDTI